MLTRKYNSQEVFYEANAIFKYLEYFQDLNAFQGILGQNNFYLLFSALAVELVVAHTLGLPWEHS